MRHPDRRCGPVTCRPGLHQATHKISAPQSAKTQGRQTTRLEILPVDQITTDPLRADQLTPGMTVIDGVDGPLTVTEVTPDADGLLIAYADVPEPTLYAAGRELDVVRQPIATAEPVEQQASWLFTFGGGQQHADRYVVLPGTYDSAREEMLRRHGQAWCGQYPVSDRAEMESYGLTELTDTEPAEAVAEPVEPAEAVAEPVEPVEAVAEPAEPPYVAPIRAMAARYRQAEQDYAICRAFGDPGGAGRALRAMTRRQRALTRVTLAVLDAQAAGQAVAR